MVKNPELFSNIMLYCTCKYRIIVDNSSQLALFLIEMNILNITNSKICIYTFKFYIFI